MVRSRCGKMAIDAADSSYIRLPAHIAVRLGPVRDLTK